VGCGGGGGGHGGMASTTAGVSSLAPVTSSTTAGTSSVTTTPVASATGPSGLLRVLTYNVAGLPQGLSSSNPNVDIPQISPKLDAYDLVCTQEDFVFNAQLIASDHHAHRTTPLFGYATFVGDGLDTFSDAPFTPPHRVKWSVSHGVIHYDNDALASKGFSFVRMEVSPGVTIDVYDLHADAGGDAGDESARQTQYQQLAQFVAYFSLDQPVIICGDTNLETARSTTDETTLQTLLAATGTTDMARTLGGDPGCIDRIMIRSTPHLTFTPVRWRLADEFKDAQGNPLSDHDAVNVDLDWSYVP
jgi:endonuclease/exonuclease/phosphatase family metal-dependent hydrolase